MPSLENEMENWVTWPGNSCQKIKYCLETSYNTWVVLISWIILSFVWDVKFCALYLGYVFKKLFEVKENTILSSQLWQNPCTLLGESKY